MLQYSYIVLPLCCDKYREIIYAILNQKTHYPNSASHKKSRPLYMIGTVCKTYVGPTTQYGVRMVAGDEVGCSKNRE